MPTNAAGPGAGELTRTTLRGQALDRLRALIVTGDLAPAANVIERDLSATLGVSRTPLREALRGLEAEGLLRTEPGRGFFVQDLSREEAGELYPLIGTLEALSVEQGRPLISTALLKQAARFRSARSPGRAVDADNAWHETLIDSCDRPRTAAILKQLRTAAARYEYRFFASLDAIASSAAQHDAITAALRRKRYREAAGFLRQNCEQGLERIREHFAPSAGRSTS
jgi:DNA-binding GntR family transcriptional regulator